MTAGGPGGARGAARSTSGGATGQGAARRRRPGRGGRDTRAVLVPGTGPLARVPAPLVFLAVVAVVAVAVLVGGLAGAALLVLLAAGVAVLLAVTWPGLTTADRAGRVGVLLLLLAVAALQVLR